MGIISQKLRDSARGQQCTFCIPGICDSGPETVVLCHAPSDSKGMGNKAHDYHAAFGCYTCHEALDQHRVDDAEFYWRRGMQRTWDAWIERGLILIPVDPATAKRRPKSKAPKPSRPMLGTKASGFKKSMAGKISQRDNCHG